jgi:hypothetical protein
MIFKKNRLELLVRLGYLKSSPIDGIIRKEVAKEMRNVTQSIRFVKMNCVVVCLKSFPKRPVPYTIELAETFVDEAIEKRIRTLLGTTPNNHVD